MLYKILHNMFVMVMMPFLFTMVHVVQTVNKISV